MRHELRRVLEVIVAQALGDGEGVLSQLHQQVRLTLKVFPDALLRQAISRLFPFFYARLTSTPSRASRRRASSVVNAATGSPEIRLTSHFGATRFPFTGTHHDS